MYVWTSNTALFVRAKYGKCLSKKNQSNAQGLFMPPQKVNPAKTTAASHPARQPGVLPGRVSVAPGCRPPVHLHTGYQTPAQTTRRRGPGSRLQPHGGASLGVWSPGGQGPDTGWPLRWAGKRRGLHPPTCASRHRPQPRPLSGLGIPSCLASGTQLHLHRSELLQTSRTAGPKSRPQGTGVQQGREGPASAITQRPGHGSQRPALLLPSPGNPGAWRTEAKPRPAATRACPNGCYSSLPANSQLQPRHTE